MAGQPSRQVLAPSTLGWGSGALGLWDSCICLFLCHCVLVSVPPMPHIFRRFVFFLNSMLAFIGQAPPIYVSYDYYSVVCQRSEDRQRATGVQRPIRPDWREKTSGGLPHGSLRGPLYHTAALPRGHSIGPMIQTRLWRMQQHCSQIADDSRLQSPPDEPCTIYVVGVA